MGSIFVLLLDIFLKNGRHLDTCKIHIWLNFRKKILNIKQDRIFLKNIFCYSNSFGFEGNYQG